MKQLIFMLFITANLFTSCKKDDNGNNNASTCANQNTATLFVSNTSSNPYTISKNGYSQGTAQPNTITEFIFAAGYWDLRAEQQSGYAFYPTVVETSDNVVKCTERTWQIP